MRHWYGATLQRARGPSKASIWETEGAGALVDHAGRAFGPPRLYRALFRRSEKPAPASGITVVLADLGVARPLPSEARVPGAGQPLATRPFSSPRKAKGLTSCQPSERSETTVRNCPPSAASRGDYVRVGMSTLRHWAFDGFLDYTAAENIHRSGPGSTGDISEKPMDIIEINRLLP